ncbi:hypothetical protein Tco_1250911, partial [Tanacetum coccineum]
MHRDAAKIIPVYTRCQGHSAMRKVLRNNAITI